MGPMDSASRLVIGRYVAQYEGKKLVRFFSENIFLTFSVLSAYSNGGGGWLRGDLTR